MSTEKEPSVPKKEIKDEGSEKRSIPIRLIRHAESMNNEVYREARYLFRGGTPEFDLDGFNQFVDERRKADPGLSERGQKQALKLRDYLVPNILNQVSHPVKVIVSPMKRAMDTILPTLIEVEKSNKGNKTNKCDVIANAFYTESEGCHIRDKPEPGMNQLEVAELLSPAVSNPSFVGFEDDPKKGWYSHGTSSETREESEDRAAKFYLWLCEFLDHQLQTGTDDDDVFDAGVSIPGDEHEPCEHDKFSPRKRKRRTAILVGHGDFMGLVLKRIVAGFGHAVESEGVPHRSAFIHLNTGMTELEYFGHGRFLLMSSNSTPHIDDASLKSGGSLKDGWSYIVPNHKHFLYKEVDVVFSDEIEGHVKEQADAMKKLYLGHKASSSNTGSSGKRKRMSKRLSSSESLVCEKNTDDTKAPGEIMFVVKRGLQVVGCATLFEESMELTDIVVRPSVRRKKIGTKLVDAVKVHVAKSGKPVDFIYAVPTCDESKSFFETLGFGVAEDGEGATIYGRLRCNL